MQKHLHIIGIGGIGVSALARYYQHLGYSVSGSDGADSPFLQTLRNEGFDIFVGHSPDNLPANTDLVIYSEAIITKPDLPPEEQIYANAELAKARHLKIRHLSYPVALGEVFNAKQGIAIAGSHGKSTTTAMTGIVLANEVNNEQGIMNSIGASVLIGTQVPQFGNSNFHYEDSDNFVIEACEYKRSFLHYRPYITVITNIDLDHLDYYKNIDDYISAFQSLVDQTSGFVVISADDKNSQKLQIPKQKKIIVGNYLYENHNDVIPANAGIQTSGTLDSVTSTEGQKPQIMYYARVEDLEKHETHFEQKTLPIPEMHLQVPGDHLLHDAHLAYAVGRLLGMQDDIIVPKLESYKGSWRRSEIVKTTKNGNLLLSDYGHHPNEIRPTLKAIKEKYPDKKLFVVFQPHQYSRTRELLPEFTVSFGDVDQLIIPNIYFSRDKKEDVEYMTTERLVDAIQGTMNNEQGTISVQNGNGLENTAKLVREYDEQNPNSSVILLLGAGDVDTLRYEID